jgi:hypothetical protein
MLFRIAADAIVVVHLAFILFVVFGGLLVVRWRRVVWVHLPAAAWGAWIEVAGWVCPLTPLENRLRERGGGPMYTSTFIDQYLLPVLYPPGLSREIQWALAAIVIVVNAVVYVVAVRGRIRYSTSGGLK